MELLFGETLASHPSSAFLGRMAPPKDKSSSVVQHTLCNAFMASTPYHDFWPTVISATYRAWEEDGLTVHGTRRRLRVEHITGPVVLLEAYESWTKTSDQRSSSHHLEVLPHQYVYPYAWYPAVGDDDSKERPTQIVQAGKAFDLDAARSRFNNGVAYACTYWGSSWQAGWASVGLFSLLRKLWDEIKMLFV